MNDSSDFVRDPAGWRLRPLLLGLLGALAAVVAQQLLDRHGFTLAPGVEIENWKIALATATGVAAGAFGFGVERARWQWAAAFALVVGAVAGLVFYWNGGGWAMWYDWRTTSLFLAIAIAVPLFQAARDRGGWRFPYPEVHGHAWTNVVLWFAGWLFVGLVFLLAWLLASLFDLIGLHFLSDLMRHNWFTALLFGGGFGAALGLLRERDGVVRLLQRVVTAVLAVLAPVLGAGLLLFLLALPFTGLHALWEATKSTTPILLGCVVGALILANAVIGNGADEEATNPVLRYGAIALALAALPLAIIAAVATGLRIDQYGLTPDRLWAVVFVTLAMLYGAAYLVALLLGRRDWTRIVRWSNLRLAFLVAGIALLLATPVASFNALSTRDQVARLEAGRIAPDKFDWAALAFDFGDPGKAALKRLTGSTIPAVRVRARTAATEPNRWAVAAIDREQSEADLLVKRLRVLPAAIPLPLALRKQLGDWNACGTDARDRCTVLYAPGAREAIAVLQSCLEQKTQAPGEERVRFRRSVDCGIVRLRATGDDWKIVAADEAAPLSATDRAALDAGAVAGRIEIRAVPARRVYIGGVPVGDPFE